MSDQKSKTDHHNEGQSDGFQNQYNGPGPSILQEIFYGEDELKEMRDNEEAYREGWDNGYKQR
jgi:hypothetical protein